MPPTKHDDPARLIYLRPGETDAEYRARMGYSPATPKSTIHKDHSPSVVDRVSGIAQGLTRYVLSSNPLSKENRFEREREKERKQFVANLKGKDENEKQKLLTNYTEKIQELKKYYGLNGGKKKSRKSRKSSKSRKNRKTRSRK